MRLRSTAAALLAAGLAAASGCTSLPADRGFDDVSAAVGERLPQTVRWNRASADDDAAAAEVDGLLRGELGADAAVQVALLNNAGLQATYESLSVGQADLVQAGLLRNPIFDAQLRFASGGGGFGLDIGIVQDFLDVFQIPLRKRVAAAEFEGVKNQVTGAVVDLAADTRRAWYELVGAKQALELRRTVLAAYEASTDIARRLHEAGNITDLARARERAQLEAARLEVADAETLVSVRREQLTAYLGLWGERATGWDVPDRLPEPADDLPDPSGLERSAVAASLDLSITRQEVFAEAERLGLTAASLQFFNNSELAAGAVAERDADGSWGVGPAVAVPIPLFDTGRVANERARAVLQAASGRYQQAAVDLRSGVRAAWSQLANAHDQAAHFRTVLLPLRQSVVDQTQLEYNAMLVGAFELLQARRDEVDDAAAYIDALQTYWQARTALDQMLAGRSAGFPGMAPAPTGGMNAGGGGDAATDRHPLSTPFPMNPTLPEPVRVAVGPATRRQVLRHGGVAVAGLAAFAAARRASATEAATAAGQAPVEADALRRGGADGANPTAAPDDREVAAQMAAGEVPHLAPGRPGVDYTPVVTPGGANLPFKVVDGIKVFHLVAEEVEHEFAPGLIATCWGYNGRCHGPTIEAVEGDRVRIYVSNRLDAPTTVHWHGVLLPSGMDGVGGVSQRAIHTGETFQYEFTLRQHGTFMYHAHHDEMTQMGMGMMGMLIVHPRRYDGSVEPLQEGWEQGPRPDRDFAIMLSEWAITPGTGRPDPNVMSDFNVLTMNAKAFPGTAPLVVEKGQRVRIRIGNLSAMDHHPIHLHGYNFLTVATDGGDVPASAQHPDTTVLVAVGQTRDIEFVAHAPGDWVMHCHMTHHVMNQMGHDLPNMIGAKVEGLDSVVQKLIPAYMTMGQEGMGDMGDMGMPVPRNSIPMVGGYGPFDYITMGGMFTIVKVREGLDSRTLAENKDPGFYEHPRGTVAAPAAAAQLRRDGIDVSEAGLLAARVPGDDRGQTAVFAMDKNPPTRDSVDRITGRVGRPDAGAATPAAVPTATKWTCVMHPEVAMDAPARARSAA